MSTYSSKSLAIKYRPKLMGEIVGQGTITDILTNQLATKTFRNTVLFTGPAGCGKAQPLTSKVLTPTGYKLMRDIQVGDSVIDGTGHTTRVEGVFPQGKRPVYRITFNDHTFIDVSDEHLNYVYRYNEDKKCKEYFTLTTLKLIDLFNKTRFSLRVDTPVIDCWEDSSQFIHPYLLGALIGDGSLSRNFNFSNSEQDVVNKVDTLLAEYGHKLKHIAGCDYAITQISNNHYNQFNKDNNVLRRELEQFNLMTQSYNKHIPQEYLFSSVNTRLELLRGLFDTDGYISKNNLYQYTTTSPQLSDDFSFLVRSLGMVDTVTTNIGAYKVSGVERKTRPYFTHTIKVPNDLVIVSSQKHLSRRTLKQTYPIRKIMSIDRIDDCDCQCILVASDCHTYITDNVTVTHNTTSARAFARVLNNGKGTPIEIDAASNNGVENVRDIIVKAQQKSLDSEYKIFIIDECFKGDTLISTANGVKFIQDIKPGEYIQNALGYGKVTKVFRNKVLTNRLCCVTINGVETVTTVDHLYFTSQGWVSAQNLRKGDVVYANIQVSKLWERIFSRENKLQLQVLLNELSTGNETSEAKNRIKSVTSEILCNMWKTVDSEIKKPNLFKTMSEQIDTTKGTRVSENGQSEAYARTTFSKNVEKQSDELSGNTAKNDTNEDKEWKLENLEWAAWWQRSIYDSTVDFIRGLEQESDIRICNTDEYGEDKRVSYLLQSRPRLSTNEISDRGGWQWSSLEKWLIQRLKENKVFEQFRVDSVTVYQRGNNDEYFERHFDRELLDSGELYFYDLEVDTHPSYFANGILVHNCHSISNAGWQAFLKLIEEPPANTIFIFCTTDPQKIPATIISRVQRFDFKRISFENIVARLKYISEQEGYQVIDEIADTMPFGKCVSAQALEQLAKICDGGMRDGITSLDKCMAFTDCVTLDKVLEALGTVNYKTYFDLTHAIFDYDESTVIDIVEQCHRSGSDLKQFIKQYTLFLLDVCKYSVFKNFDYIQIPSIYENDLQPYTSQSARQFLKYLLDEVNKLNSEIKWESSVKNIVQLRLLILTQPEEDN